MNILDIIILQAKAEIGHDQLNSGTQVEDYINSMTNFEFLEFLIRCGLITSPK